MSGWGETPEKKSVIQVPDSSPLSNRNTPQTTRLAQKSKPASLVSQSTTSLREKFAFNGTNIMTSNGNPAATLANRDLHILQNMFKTVTPTMIRAVYNTKANKDLKQAKVILTALVEKRKKEEQLNLLNKRNAQEPASVSPPPAKAVIKKKKPEVQVISSPETSPQKASSKVILDKKKTISQKYSHAMKEAKHEVFVVEDEPKPKKRRLVRGSRNATPIDEIEITGSRALGKDEINLLDDDGEEEEEEPLAEDDMTDDSDVEESSLVATSTDDFWDSKVVEFMNSAEARDIADAAQCSLEDAQRVVDKRPFNSINHFESFNFSEEAASKRKRKTDGEIFSQRVNLILRGYGAVDSLVKQCNSYSASIAQEISKWGVKVHGVNDELEIVDVSVDEDDDGDFGASKRRSRGGYFKTKPSLLSGDIDLKNYQQVGLNWLNLLYNNKLSCILADEMGLGKTCQVIAFLAHLKETKRPDTPHLIVVPSSTLENWMREFSKFAPSLVVEPYYGSQAEREDMRYALAERWDRIDVVVTTYNLATSSKDDLAFLKSGNFNCVVYDEGHMLKNSTTERFQKLMKLKGQFRLLLTGTPLQNNLRELMSLLEFILPSIFVSKKEDLKYVFHQKATTKDGSKDYNPLLSQRAISKAKKMMAPFILRRRKDQVLQHLPPKYTKIDHCELVDEQREVYEREVLKGIEMRESKSTKVANILMHLRKAAIHPMLFRYRYDDETLRLMSKEIMKEAVYRDANQQFIFEDMEVMTDFELHNLCRKFPSISEFQLDESYFMQSGKVQSLKKLLPDIIEKDGKVLIFSMFTQVLDILEVVLSQWSIKFLRLDGSTSVDIRQDIIDKFYEEETIPVFLLSTRAGGFGINLVCANNVIIFDQSFNPHDDKQAEDRAHRVGQKRPVQVTRLITKDTIEDGMFLLAQNKLELDMSMSGDQIENSAVSFIDKMVFDDPDVQKLKEDIKKRAKAREEFKPLQKLVKEEVKDEVKEEVSPDVKEDTVVPKQEVKQEKPTKSPSEDKENRRGTLDFFMKKKKESTPEDVSVIEIDEESPKNDADDPIVID